MYRKEVDSGPGGIHRLPIRSKDRPYPGSWSTDGENLAFVVRNRETRNDIWILSREGRSEPFLQATFSERYPEFSPDGRWLAYASRESGREEVYVCPYPGPGRSVQISRSGGAQPAWSHDGREVLYRSSSEVNPLISTFFAVEVKVDGNRFTPGRPQKLFEGCYQIGAPVRSYDVGLDGRFLLVKQPDETSLSLIKDKVFPTRIRIVQNWCATLQEKIPGDG
ncbi:TolB family protein [Candidatus Eisenbacteria bacterium]|uniref:TolB family protein n=1 Tax=Eiseniibacteriota bacterium TaxID=2212470 RepID=A0ABV6YJS3_UNCEI